VGVEWELSSGNPVEIKLLKFHHSALLRLFWGKKVADFLSHFGAKISA